MCNIEGLQAVGIPRRVRMNRHYKERIVPWNRGCIWSPSAFLCCLIRWAMPCSSPSDLGISLGTALAVSPSLLLRRTFWAFCTFYWYRFKLACVVGKFTMQIVRIILINTVNVNFIVYLEHKQNTWELTEKVQAMLMVTVDINWQFWQLQLRINK